MEKSQVMFGELLHLVKVLRGDEGCPWDRKQTLESLKKYLQEESQELAEAIEKNDSESIQEEIGDTLFLLLFAAEIARDLGYFTIEDVLEAIREKMTRRHPHVFGEHRAKGIPEIREKWKAIKDEEKRSNAAKPVRDRIPRHLSPLLRAYWLIGKQRESAAGSDGAVQGAATLLEHAALLQNIVAYDQGEEVRKQVGLLFLALTGLCHTLKMNPEQAVEEALAGLVGSVADKEGRET
jgi:tetrapyrrole methylase family protein / MazG family protein